MPNAKPVRTRTPVSFGLQNIVPLTAISALLLISSRARAADLAAPNTGTMTGAGLALATKATDPGQYAFITERLTEWKVVLGGGAMIAPKFEGSDEFEVSPVPFVSATFGERVKVDPSGLSVNLYDIDGLSFSAQLGYDSGRKQDDSDHLRGLGDIDAGAVVGGKLAYELGPVELYASIDRIIGGSDGLQAKFGADLSSRYERFLFTAGVSGTWADDNYMEAYFGVTPKQSANSGLPVYDIGAGIKRVDVEASVTYMASENWLIRGQAGLGYLVGDVADSPIVQREVQPYGMLMVGYKF
jgi:outer membrane scaffolding protein for murein synthesis (MipA/OmpV family)